MPFNHDEYAAGDNKAVSDTDDMGVGTVATPPNFDHVDEKKILWKVTISRLTSPTAHRGTARSCTVDGYPVDPHAGAPLPSLIS